ncbi:MAG: magnesium/cobalt transporter CorA [Thermodesulfobacteriota bacterium]
MSKTHGKKLRKKPERLAKKSGMPPGTMAFVGRQKVENARIDVLHYDETSVRELIDADVNQCSDVAKEPGVTWINVNGIHDTVLIEALGQRFGLHPLTLEDIVNTTQRPKVEEFTSYLYVVLKMIGFDDTESQLKIEHVSLILGDGFVISFLEDEGDVFDPVRGRIQSTKGRIRTMKSDYLAYALVDAVVDHYFVVVERIGDRIEEIDDRILTDPNPNDIHEIHQLKDQILNLRKAVWPLREEIGALEKIESTLIRPETRVYLRDIYDHTIQIIDMLETFRDIIGNMHDTYLSSISIRMNEIMKVLTIIATIFIPLTFIVGVYGMNFENLPELKWRYGYFMVWGMMIAVAGGLIVYFKRNRWI